MPGDTLTLTLDPPVTVGGLELRELKLREPTVEDMDRASREATEHAGTAVLIERIAGVPKLAARSVPASIAAAANAYFATFLPAGAEPPEGQAGGATRELPLDPPLALKGMAEVDVLRLREPTLGAMDRAQQQMHPFAFMAVLIGASSNLNEVQARALPVSAGRVALDFLLGFQAASAR